MLRDIWRMIATDAATSWRSARETWLRLYYRMCDYPPRWYWPITRIFGGPDGVDAGPYMTRIILGPLTPRVVLFGRCVWPGGQPYLHIFHRQDVDRDPHDHPFPFWTLPLNQPYIETVYDHERNCFQDQMVKHFQWSYRPATHTHRVVSCPQGWPLVTLVWRFPSERKWGFWCHAKEVLVSTVRHYVPWKRYCYDRDGEANIEGVDTTCPGRPEH